MESALGPISPDLVLVCPELREAALAELPEEFEAVAPAGSASWGAALGYAAARFAGLALSALVWLCVLAALTTAPLVLR